MSNTRKLIAVVGATGQQGGAVVRALQASGQFKVRALTRDPAKHPKLADEVIAADLNRPETLTAAFAGAYGVFLVTNAWEAGRDESRQALAAVNAAKQAGETGPLARAGCADPVMQAYSGFACQNGAPGEAVEAFRFTGFLDLTTSSNATQAVLAALNDRAATGLGRKVIWTTIRIGLLTTGFALLIGYPLAHWSARIKSRAGHALLLMAVLFLMLVPIGSNLLVDPDSQWHVAVGSKIWNSGRLPMVDELSHTFAGSPWIATQWLSELFLFGAFSVAGWSGVVVLTAFMIASAFALLFYWLQGRTLRLS